MITIKNKKNMDSSIDQIWSNKKKKEESQVDKISFYSLINKLEELEELMTKENFYDIFVDTKNKNESLFKYYLIDSQLLVFNFLQF